MCFNYKIIVSYDGTNFSGFQRQTNARSIQGELEKAITRLNSQRQTFIKASGRTDAKVHAENQVCSFESDKEFEKNYFLIAINNLLPDDIYVKDIEVVTKDFHPRFDAISKKYCYYINTGEYDVFKSNYILQLNKKLDIEKMREASKIFIKEQDFRSFSSALSTQNSIREIFSIKITQKNDIIKVEYYGNSFLRYMVRKITMALIDVGQGRLTNQQIKDILAARDIAAYSKIAGGQGLYLVQVDYENEV